MSGNNGNDTAGATCFTWLLAALVVALLIMGAVGMLTSK
jgi:hypothetical protein